VALPSTAVARGGPPPIKVGGICCSRTGTEETMTTAINFANPRALVAEATGLYNCMEMEVYGDGNDKDNNDNAQQLHKYK
jgi:hypothetical protein